MAEVMGKLTEFLLVDKMDLYSVLVMVDRLEKYMVATMDALSDNSMADLKVETMVAYLDFDLDGILVV